MSDTYSVIMYIYIAIAQQNYNPGHAHVNSVWQVGMRQRQMVKWKPGPVMVPLCIYTSVHLYKLAIIANGSRQHNINFSMHQWQLA